MGAAATRMRRARRAAGGVVQRVGGGGRCPGFGTAKKGGKWLRRRGLARVWGSGTARGLTRGGCGGVEGAEGGLPQRERWVYGAREGVAVVRNGVAAAREGVAAAREVGGRRAGGDCRVGEVWQVRGEGRWGRRAAGGVTRRVDRAAGGVGCRKARGRSAMSRARVTRCAGAGGRTKALPILGGVGTLPEAMVGRSAAMTRSRSTSRRPSKRGQRDGSGMGRLVKRPHSNK